MFAGCLGLLRSQGSGDELRSQWVKHVGLLQLQSLQLGFDLLKRDSMQTAVIMADGDERFPEFSVQGKRDVYSEQDGPQSQLCLLYTAHYSETTFVLLDFVLRRGSNLFNWDNISAVQLTSTQKQHTS